MTSSVACSSGILTSASRSVKLTSTLSSVSLPFLRILTRCAVSHIWMKSIVVSSLLRSDNQLNMNIKPLSPRKKSPHLATRNPASSSFPYLKSTATRFSSASPSSPTDNLYNAVMRETISLFPILSASPEPSPRSPKQDTPPQSKPSCYKSYLKRHPELFRKKNEILELL